MKASTPFDKLIPFAFIISAVAIDGAVVPATDDREVTTKNKFFKGVNSIIWINTFIITINATKFKAGIIEKGSYCMFVSLSDIFLTLLIRITNTPAIIPKIMVENIY